MSTRPAALGVCCATFLGALLGGCTQKAEEGGGRAALVVSDTRAGVIAPRSTTGSTVTVVTSGACVTQGQTVELTKVSATGVTGDVRVTDFTVWDSEGKVTPDSYYGRSALKDSPAAAGSKTVERSCDDERFDAPAWFVVELETSGKADALARVTGFDISYRAAAREKRTSLPYEFTICPSKDSSSKDCEPPGQ